jgi:hypothetical protein
VAPAPAWATVVGSSARLALFPLFTVAFTAPFGTTILGLIAISQIRRSRGQLYGMPLAIFDTLVFPLLLLDVLIVGLTTEVLTHGANAVQSAVAVAIALAAAIVADVWIVRRVRDAVKTPVAAAPQQPSA